MRLLRYLGFLISLAMVVLVVVVIALYGFHRDSVPKVMAIADFRPSLKSRVFAQDGELIAEFGVHDRIVVKKEELPPLVIKAFIASEDKNFYRHHGIDFGGVASALLQSIAGKRSTLRGASTISQQLAKGILIKDHGYEQATARTIARKIKEALLARHLEMHLSKEDILWMYLNDVYLGNGAYGVAAAAHNYFRKELKDLRLSEIALMAGLLQAPSRFSPKGNLTAALTRQGYVLNRMVEDGYITIAEHESALAENKTMVIHDRDNNFRRLAPYLSEAVRKMVVDEFGEKIVYQDGLNIYTTLDMHQERIMQQVLKRGLIEVDKRQGYLGPIFRPRDRAELAKARHVIDQVLEERSVLGGFRVAMVERVDHANNVVNITTGSKHGVILLSGMKWARPRDPAISYDQGQLASVANVFNVGDVILVKELDGEELIFSLEQEPLTEGAMFAMEPDSGYVKAISGGYSFDRSEFNRIFQACRMPGSLFKPVVFSAAIAIKKYTPATLLVDAPLTFHDAQSETTWRPKNLNKDFKGEVTVREALMRSMNIPTINVMADVGTKNLLLWAGKLGITSKLKPELGTAIGSSCVTPFELGGVYAAIANMGVKKNPILIKEIIDRDGHRVKFNGHKNDPWIKRSDRVALMVDDFMAQEDRVMEPEVAYTMHYLLSEGAKYGTAARTNVLNRHVAGKTGTTNDSFDTWFAGYVKNLMALVWIGNDSMELPLGTYEQGARTALPLFSRFMEGALTDLPDEDWIMPNTMCLARIDSATGLRIMNERPMSFVAPFRCGEEPAPLETHPHQSLEQAMETMGGI